jgi:hypothetical protein
MLLTSITSTALARPMRLAEASNCAHFTPHDHSELLGALLVRLIPGFTISVRDCREAHPLTTMYRPPWYCKFDREGLAPSTPLASVIDLYLTTSTESFKTQLNFDDEDR